MRLIPLMLALLILLPAFALAAEVKPEPICIIYFYGDGCPNCAKIKPFMDTIEQEYGSQVHMQRFELYHNLNNYQKYADYCEIKKIPIEDRGVPMVAIGDSFFTGTTAIRENLIHKIDEMIETGERSCPLGEDICIEAKYNQTEDTDSLIPSLKGRVTLPLIITTALIDGINPCAFAVLVFLLMFLVSVSDSKARMLKAGAAYVAAVYVSYFLAGFGLFRIIQVSGFSSWIVIIAGALAIVLGLVNIKDYFWYGAGISLQIPASMKPTVEKWVYRANIPAAIILGFLVSMFELPCTGGVYLAILAMLANTATTMQAALYLLLYNLFFVLPLVVIVAAVAFGMKAEHIEKWRGSNKNIMKLAMGLLLLALGIAMLMGWI